ncbi:TetR/AcrR family transcriptional regulator [Streptomyces sp. NPDC002138]|uniref:TetR/AcrR family transcriptional regulator n=1 Tax=Streptomyces sp. NPDC002138 TaxID=3154410 RepID=UPI00331CC5D9
MSTTPAKPAKSVKSAPRTGGRLRNEEAHRSVIEATAALLLENGYGALTIEGIAKRANVAKSTVYRWWKTKPELVMDAFTHTPEPGPDTGTLAGDLTAFLAGLYATAGDPVSARALGGLAAEARLAPASAAPFEAWARTRHDLVRALFARAASREEISPVTEAGLDRAADLVLGPFWYRLLVTGAAPAAADAGADVASVLHGLTGGRIDSPG